MKKIFALICIVVLVCSFGIASASYYDYNYRWTGIVICTNISIRESPSTSAKRYGQLYNGDVCTIVGEQNGWYYIDLSSTGLNVSDGIGYAKSSLIVRSPCWIVLTKYTPVYADPWYTGRSNGEISANTPMLVVSESQDFYCVQTHSGHAGSSFVRKSDVGRFTPECEPQYAVIVDGPVNVYAYSYESSGVIASLKNYELVQVLSWGSDFSYVFYEKNGEIIYGYIKTNFVQPVIN